MTRRLVGLLTAVTACTSTPAGPHPMPDAGVTLPLGDTGTATLASTGTTVSVPKPVTTGSSAGSTSSASTMTTGATSATTTATTTTSAPTTDTSQGTTSTQTSEQNSSGALPTNTVHFDPPGGTFVEQQTLRLTLTDGRAIHYTLDGSVPDATAPVYTSPIELDETAVVRTFVAGVDGAFDMFAAQPYVELRDDVADFTSNLPLVVINRHRDEPLDRESNELRPASLLLFEPGNDGRAHLLGPASLAMRSGVRVRGAFSRGFPQVGYAVETWEAGVDEDEAVPFLGMPAESDWVLSAPSEMDRALMRNRFAMDVSRELGQYASRAKFVEVFLVDNEDTASLGQSDYMGAYTALEKIKRDSARVDVEKLEPTDLDATTITGGYIFRIDRATDFNAGGYDFGWVYPEPEIMLANERADQADYLRNYLDEFFVSATSDSFVHPITAKHYSDYIDVDSFINHNLVTALTKNVDGLRLSAYFYKQRDQRVVAGPVWDFDRSLGTPHDERAVRPDEWAIEDGTEPLSWGFWDDLFSDPEFANAYWARWDELRSDVFALEHLVALVDSYEEELREARDRHFERWQELPPSESPAHEVQIIRDWLAQRLEWIDAQQR